MSYKKIGVVAADDGEYKPFYEAVSGAVSADTPFKGAFRFSCGKSEVLALLCGIGKVNAAAGTMYLIDSGCDCILNFGLSGGLKGVGPGDFIAPDSFLEHDFDLTPLGYKPCEKPGQAYIYYADKQLTDIFCNTGFVKQTGTAVCGDRFISDKESRNYLINTFSATSCDMETAAIASVCHMSNIPFASLRRISDGADDNAADSYSSMNKNEGITLGEAFIKCLKGVADV